MRESLIKEKKKAFSLYALRHYQDAKKVFKNILHDDPGDADCWHLLSSIYGATGDYVKAEHCASKTISLQPKHCGAYVNHGNALLALGRLDEALISYEKGLNLQPQNSKLLYNLACCYKEMGSIGEAEKYYRSVIELSPEHSFAINNLGSILYSKTLFEDALVCFQRASKLNPGFTEAELNKSMAYIQLGFIEEAVTCLRGLLQQCPENHQARSVLIFALNYSENISAKQLLREHIEWGDRFSVSIETCKLHGHISDPGKIIRVGYVSPDFMFSAPAYVLEPLLQYHNEHEVEVYCYSDVRMPDKMTKLLCSFSHHWRDISKLADSFVVKQIIEDKIDILVDLNGHIPPRHRLGVFAAKPAPIQVTYLGYPNTTGLKHIEYRLTDVVADPKDEASYSTEELFRMNGSFACFKCPEDVPDVSRPPCMDNEFITLGSLNNPAKLNKDVLELWARVLDEVPNTRLIVFRHVLKGRARSRLEGIFTSFGISRDRLDIRHSLPAGVNHMTLYNEVDIALDPFPWNGHITTFEAMWMGVPVVTLYGKRHSSRMSASVLNAVGLEHLIAGNEDEYVYIVSDLCDSKNKLTAIRSNLRQLVTNSDICDGRSFARRIEEAYRCMWQRWCSGH